ncbi:MAG TPA: hypothetical protein VH008_01100 [Pseudonocardia sp.]|nr:hypothetical protein [Pseudonocardia sp.]
MRAICAESEERAAVLRGPMDVLICAMHAGRSAPLPSPTEAMRHPFTDELRRELATDNAHQAYGAPDAVLAKLHQLAESTGAAELKLVTPVYELADRARSYELIAKHNT